MRKDIAERWADALESGEYRKCQGVLKKEYPTGAVFHCAEGVLCELYEQEQRVISTKWKESEVKGGGAWVKDAFIVYAYGNHYLTTRIPAAVAEWAGLVDPDEEGTNPILYINDDDAEERYAEDMATLNDHGWKFADLAPLIRDQWRTL